MSEKRALPTDQQSQLKSLIARGKEQGYLTYAEVNDHLPSGIVDPEQIEDIVNMINDMGITVYEKAPDAESLLLTDNAVSDDDACEKNRYTVTLCNDSLDLFTVSPISSFNVRQGCMYHACTF